MKKPVQFTIVSAVPFFSAKAFCATKVDKSGESAITTIPHKNRNPMHKISNSLLKTNGEIKQQMQDKSKEVKAIFFAPNF